MTISQLQYVIAVAELSSFYKAAARCFVTQPTLSQQVKKLEDEVGAELFDRTQKPIALTPTGEIIIAQARIVVREAQKINGLVSIESQDLSGDLRLAMIPTLAPFLLPGLVAKLKKDVPKLRLHVE